VEGNRLNVPFELIRLLAGRIHYSKSMVYKPRPDMICVFIIV